MKRSRPKLRHKLIIGAAIIITTLLGVGIVSILRMEKVLNELEQIETNTRAHLATTDQLVNLVNRLGAEHALTPVDRATHEEAVRVVTASLNKTINDLLSSPVIEWGDSEPVDRLVSLCHALQIITGEHGSVPTGEMPGDSGIVLEYARRIQVAANEVMRSALENSARERAQTTRQFRWLLAGAAVVFLMIIDVLLVVMMKASSSVLTPVNRLIEAGQRISPDPPGRRVEPGRQDEFDELEQIFHDLAGQLDTNEHKMVDTVHQVARALSHELNNAIAIVDLQLSCIERAPGVESAVFAEHTEQIHQAMLRVSAVVATLSRVQRIVLTDYLSGVQMLDLQKSTTDDRPNDDRPVDAQLRD